MISDPKSYNDSALMLRYLVLKTMDGEFVGVSWDQSQRKMLRALLDQVRSEIMSRITTGEHHSP